MVGFVSRDEEDLERAKAHLRSLQLKLPELIQHLQRLAIAHGRGDLAASLPDAEGEAERLAGLVAYMEHYSVADSQTLGPIDLREVLEEAVALTRGEIERKGQVGFSYRGAPLVRGNPRQLGQVFISLLINAGQALPAGAPKDNFVAIELETNEDGWARAAIADSGSGISPDDLPYIFQPQYSTKRGKGRGIGLAIVRETIMAMGGRISVESAPGNGALFIVELPPAS